METINFDLDVYRQRSATRPGVPEMAAAVLADAQTNWNNPATESDQKPYTGGVSYAGETPTPVDPAQPPTRLPNWP